MTIQSIIPQLSGLSTVIHATEYVGGVEKHFSFMYSHAYQNIYDPNKSGEWLGNGWDTLNDAILYVIGL